jgi:hypothetical protein
MDAQGTSVNRGTIHGSGRFTEFDECCGSPGLPGEMKLFVFLGIILLGGSSAAGAQTLAGLQGRVFDTSRAVLPAP